MTIALVATAACDDAPGWHSDDDVPSASSSASETTAIPIGGRLVVVSPQTGIYHAAYPDFGGTEDQVAASKVNDFEKLAGRHIAWAEFSDNWGASHIVFPAASVAAVR